MQNLFEWCAWEQTRAQAIWRSLTRQRLHSSFLFSGGRGLGKRVFAKRLSRLLLCDSIHQVAVHGGASNLFEEEQVSPNALGEAGKACGDCASCKLMLAGTHPDFHWLRPEEGKQQIPVDAIRQLAEKLLQTSQVSASKVCVIEPAEAMNESAANALLKLLEEPPDNTYFVLVCDNSDRVLPTIRSRCLVETFGVPEKALVFQDLSRQYDVSDSQFETLWVRHRGFVGHMLSDISQVEPHESVNPKLIIDYLDRKVSRKALLSSIDRQSLPGFLDDAASVFSGAASSLKIDGELLGPTKAEALYQRTIRFKLSLASNPNLNVSLVDYLLDCSRLCSSGSLKQPGAR